MAFDYYLALLQLHIAVVGVVIAGIIALVQMLNNAKPHRDIRLLIRRRFLVLYGVLLLGLAFVLAYATWVCAFPEQALATFGKGVVNFYADGRVALYIITLSIVSLVWFAQLALKARTLLDSQLYLQRYV